MGLMHGWKVEVNGLAWRYKNGPHATEKRLDGTRATLNRIEIRIPARDTKPAETVFRPLGLDLPDERKEQEALSLIKAILLQLGCCVPVTADTAKTIGDLWPIYEKRVMVRDGRLPRDRDKLVWDKHVVPLLGYVPLAQVNHSDYGDDYIVKRRAQGASNGTILREFVTINAVMNSAVRKRVITHNWLGEVDKIETVSREVVVPLPVIEEVMKYASRPLQRAIIVALTTAQRQGKVWEMSIGRVKMDADARVGRIIKLDKALTESKGNPENLPLCELAYAALTDGLPQLHPSMVRAFACWNAPRSLSNAFTDACRTAKERGTVYKQFLAEEKLKSITFHDLRHTANSMLQTSVAIDSGARKKLLGHADGSNDIYSHLWGMKLRQAVDFLGEVYRPLAAYMGYEKAHTVRSPQVAAAV